MQSDSPAQKPADRRCPSSRPVMRSRTFRLPSDSFPNPQRGKTAAYGRYDTAARAPRSKSRRNSSIFFADSHNLRSVYLGSSGGTRSRSNSSTFALSALPLPLATQTPSQARSTASIAVTSPLVAPRRWSLSPCECAAYGCRSSTPQRSAPCLLCCACALPGAQRSNNALQHRVSGLPTLLPLVRNQALRHGFDFFGQRTEKAQFHRPGTEVLFKVPHAQSPQPFRHPQKRPHQEPPHHEERNARNQQHDRQGPPEASPPKIVPLVADIARVNQDYQRPFQFDPVVQRKHLSSHWVSPVCPKAFIWVPRLIDFSTCVLAKD